MLHECQRVLKSTGRIRLATPDLAQILAIYTNPDGALQQAYIRWIMDNFRPQVGDYNPAQVINQSFHGWRHRFIYDEATFRGALERAGFVNIGAAHTRRKRRAQPARHRAARRLRRQRYRNALRNDGLRGDESLGLLHASKR